MEVHLLERIEASEMNGIDMKYSVDLNYSQNLKENHTSTPRQHRQEKQTPVTDIVSHRDSTFPCLF
eukprot:m.283799 g.283799  ORF g.283799 m.283799 type:complete len:66 (+) comp15758_c0_seq3:980-1177(+)